MYKPQPRLDVNQLDSMRLNCPMNSRAIAIPSGNSWVKAMPNQMGREGFHPRWETQIDNAFGRRIMTECKSDFIERVLPSSC